MRSDRMGSDRGLTSRCSLDSAVVGACLLFAAKTGRFPLGPLRFGCISDSGSGNTNTSCDRTVQVSVQSSGEEVEAVRHGRAVPCLWIQSRTQGCPSRCSVHALGQVFQLCLLRAPALLCIQNPRPRIWSAQAVSPSPSQLQQEGRRATPHG